MMENNSEFQEEGNEETLLKNTASESKTSKRKRKPRKKKSKTCLLPEGMPSIEGNEQSSNDSLPMTSEHLDESTVYGDKQNSDDQVEQCITDQQTSESSKKKRKNRKRKSKSSLPTGDAASQESGSPKSDSEALLANESNSSFSMVLVADENKHRDDDPVVQEIYKYMQNCSEDETHRTHEYKNDIPVPHGSEGESGDDKLLDDSDNKKVVDPKPNSNTHQKGTDAVPNECDNRDNNVPVLHENENENDDAAVPRESREANDDPMRHESGDQKSDDSAVHETGGDLVIRNSDELKVEDPLTEVKEQNGSSVLANVAGFNVYDKETYDSANKRCTYSVVAESGSVETLESSQQNDDTVNNQDKQYDSVVCEISVSKCGNYGDTLFQEQNCENSVANDTNEQNGDGQISLHTLSQDQNSNTSVSGVGCPVIDKNDNQNCGSENNHEDVEHNNCTSVSHENDDQSERFCRFVSIYEAEQNDMYSVTSELQNQNSEDKVTLEPDNRDTVFFECHKKVIGDAPTPERDEHKNESAVAVLCVEHGTDESTEISEQNDRKSATTEQDGHKDENTIPLLSDGQIHVESIEIPVVTLEQVELQERGAVTFSYDEQNVGESTKEEASLDISSFTRNVDRSSSSFHAGASRKNRHKPNVLPQSLKRSSSEESAPPKRRKNKVQSKSKGIFEIFATVQVFCFLLTCHAVCALLSVFKRKSDSKQVSSH